MNDVLLSSFYLYQKYVSPLLQGLSQNHQLYSCEQITVDILYSNINFDKPISNSIKIVISNHGKEKTPSRLNPYLSFDQINLLSQE